MPYLSHISALECLKRPDVYALMEPADSIEYPEQSRICTTNINLGDARIPDCASKPYHVLVPDASRYWKSPALKFHAWKPPLPNGSMLKLGKDTFCSSPEFCFLQMATMLTKYELITLGFELCGNYSILPTRYIERPHVTTPSRLASFAQRCSGRKGNKLAGRIAKYLVGNAASPSESALAALISLPRALGGYGIPKPKLNAKIPLGEEAQRVTGKMFYRCDLLWEKQKVATEYDSDSEHTGPERIAADSLRRNVLQLEKGITLITVTNKQLRDPTLFQDVAKQTAKMLGIKFRKKPASDYYTELDLREALFRHERMHDF